MDAEADRSSAPRPFPFMPMMDPAVFLDRHLTGWAGPAIVYRAVGKYTSDELDRWLSDVDSDRVLTVLVGAASRHQVVRTSLPEAYRRHAGISRAPRLGGVVIGHETGRGLGLPAMFVERKDGAFALRRGFSLERGEPVVLVEDVFTTGKSTREAAAAVESAGGRVVAVGSIVDRGLPPGAFSVPYRSLLALSVPSWPEAECPPCRRGVPIDSPGSGPP